MYLFVNIISCRYTKKFVYFIFLFDVYMNFFVYIFWGFFVCVLILMFIREVFNILFFLVSLELSEKLIGIKFYLKFLNEFIVYFF